jgi:CheY-like chemotaxis protein
MKTILVVDDRPEARYATVKTLMAAGYDVRETATGRDALRLARLSPDLIVLDVVLPDMDGFEVCRRLKSDVTTGPIPVLHKTAVYGDPDHRRRGLAAGAEEYLSDPVEPALLVATVERLLQRRPGQG